MEACGAATPPRWYRKYQIHISPRDGFIYGILRQRYFTQALPSERDIPCLLHWPFDLTDTTSRFLLLHVSFYHYTKNYQGLLSGIFQTGKFLEEMATLSFTVKFLAKYTNLQSLNTDF